MADQIRSELVELEDTYQSVKQKYYELRAKREELEEKLTLEELKSIDKIVPFYTKKLERLKKYSDDFVLSHNRCGNVEYAFQKVDGYIDDFHNPTNDPLNWKLSEYDLLEMSQHLEIVFEYSNDSVREFVERWMSENVVYAGLVLRESMFTLKLDRK